MADSSMNMFGDSQVLQALEEIYMWAMATVDLQGTVQTWNMGATRMFGWSASDTVGEDLSMLPELKKAISIITVRARGGVDTQDKLTFSCKDKVGRNVIASVCGACIREKESKNPSGVVVLFNECSRLQSLEKTSYNYTMCQKIGNVGNWEWTADNDEIWWSDGFMRLLGKKNASSSFTWDTFMDLVHVQDREGVKLAILASQHGVPLSLSHRIVLSDGSLRLIHHEGKVIMSNSNTQSSLFVVVTLLNKKKGAVSKSNMDMNMNSKGMPPRKGKQHRSHSMGHLLNSHARDVQSPPSDVSNTPSPLSPTGFANEGKKAEVPYIGRIARRASHDPSGKTSMWKIVVHLPNDHKVRFSIHPRSTVRALAEKVAIFCHIPVSGLEIYADGECLLMMTDEIGAVLRMGEPAYVKVLDNSLLTEMRTPEKPRGNTINDFRLPSSGGDKPLLQPNLGDGKNKKQTGMGNRLSKFNHLSMDSLKDILASSLEESEGCVSPELGLPPRSPRTIGKRVPGRRGSLSGSGIIPRRRSIN